MLKQVSFTAVSAVIVSFLWLPFASAQTEEFSGNINIFAGQKSLNSDDWSDELLDISKQNEIGIMIDFKQKDWPISIAIDYRFSKADDSGSGSFVDPFAGNVTASEDVKGETSELNLGVRKIFDLPSPIRPFIGGGISFVTAKQSVDQSGSSSVFGSFSDSFSDSDSAVGGWIDGGVYATLAEHFNIGVELAYTQATVTLFDESTDAGGFHYGLLAGYHW
jgi:opacity protein-like surface antigen